jgi:hypothetical protein
MWMHKTQNKESAEAALREIETSTDRATAIVAVAFVEDHMTIALRRRFVRDEKALDEMFKESRPVGAFGPKIQLAYLVGMFSGRVASDLHYLRRMRNEFAHNFEIDSFGSAPVKDWAMNLKLVDYYNLEVTTGQTVNRPGLIGGSNS